jgi:hypothetical protein
MMVIGRSGQAARAGMAAAAISMATAIAARSDLPLAIVPPGAALRCVSSILPRLLRN